MRPQKTLPKSVLSKMFGDVDKKLDALFEKTRKAFIESDEEGAKRAWEDEREITTKCDKIVEELDIWINSQHSFDIIYFTIKIYHD